MLFFEEFVNCLTVCDAFLYEAEIRFVHNRCKSGKISCISQAVQAYDAIVRMSLHHMKNKIASDKSGTAGNDNCHVKKSPFIILFSEVHPGIFHPEHPSDTVHTGFS